MVELADPTETSEEAEEEQREDAARRCRRCGNVITHDRHAIEVEGLHEHVQANPAGCVFLFGAFAQAEGCDFLGDPTREHTWFGPYAWQVAVCDGCLTHLGWYFHSGSDGFFGLLLDRLTRG